MSLEIGQIIDGKYRIVRLIGEGGMGAVFEGENARIARRVAIKVLHAATALNSDAVRRFEREAQAAGRIGSDHILEILDLGAMADGDRYMVMEFLDGEPLANRIKSHGRLTPRQLVPLARQLLAGLGAAHAAGIIHRDLKPDNVFILKEKAGQPDFVKIIDFGISKFQSLSGDSAMSMTRTGTVMGTPYYMSPEQANGSREADARSDLYSVGVMLYEAVTGQVPFDARSFNELLFKIVLSKPPSPQTIVPDIDPAFCSIILKGMSRELEHRFQSAQEFSRALDDWWRTGAAVTIPPEDRQAVTVAVPQMPAAGNTGYGATPMPQQSSPDLRASGAGMYAQPMGQGSVGPGTPGVAFSHSVAGVGQGAPPAGSGSWATSQEPVSIPKRSNAPLFAALAIAGVVVLGGGGFAAYKLSSGHDATPSGAGATGTAPAGDLGAQAKPASPVASAAAPAASVAKPAETAAPTPTVTLSDPKPEATHAAPVPAAAGLKPQPAKPGTPAPAKPGPVPGGKKPGGQTPDFGY